MSKVNKNKKYSIILTDRQEVARRILMEKNKYNHILFDGGSRAGKTFIILLCLILLCMKFDGIRILIARMKFAHARASLWEQTLIPLLGKLNIQNIDRSMFIIRIGKSEIWLAGLDNKEKTEKVLGQEYSVIYLNEAVEIPQSIRDVVKTRLAQNVEGFHNFMVYDCNPRQPTHYLYSEFYVKSDFKRKALKFLPKDNKENLPAGYIEEMLEDLPEDKKARFLRGEWAYSPGAVYHNITEKNKINCEKNIYKFYDDVVVGVDFGLYMCANIWGIKRDINKIKAYCIHEIIILGGVTKDLIHELDKIYGIKQENIILYCDHEPDRISELQSAGYQAKPAYKDVGPGDGSVNEYEIYFDHNCTHTFQSMLNLVNQEAPNGQGFLYGKHVKENDHEADAGRYALHGWKMDNNMGESNYIIERDVI